MGNEGAEKKRQLSGMKEAEVQASETTLRESGFLYSGTYANLAIGNTLWLCCALF